MTEKMLENIKSEVFEVISVSPDSLLNRHLQADAQYPIQFKNKLCSGFKALRNDDK